MRNALVFYTNFGVPAGAAGCARGPLIFIRPEYRGDAGLLAHEKLHVWQWVRTLCLHSFMYGLSDRYVLKSEVEAYQAQAKHYPDDRMPLFARYIANDYGLRISVAEALARLRGGV